MIGWLLIGFLVYLFGLCPFLGWLWKTKIADSYCSNIDNFTDWMRWVIEGILITIVLGILITGIIFIIIGL